MHVWDQAENDTRTKGGKIKSSLAKSLKNYIYFPN